MERVLNDSRVGRFIVALMAAAAGILLRIVLEPVAGPAALWLCYTGAVILSAWYGGLRPGFLTTSVVAISAAYTIDPQSHSDQMSSTDGWALTVFIALSLAICFAMQGLRMERLRAMHAESRLRDVLESSYYVVVSVDQELACIYGNAQAAKLARRPPQQLPGRSLRTLFPETPGSALYRELNRVLMDRTPVQFQDYMESTKRWYEFEVSPSRGGINLFVRDITDTKQMETERSTAAEKRQPPGTFERGGL